MNQWEAAQWDRQNHVHYGDQQQPARDRSKATSGGRWVHRDKDIHRCPKPPYERGIKVGDLWECGTCHTVHRVSKIDGDQRDGSTWLVWQEHESYKSGPFAPGTK